MMRTKSNTEKPIEAYAPLLIERGDADSEFYVYMLDEYGQPIMDYDFSMYTLQMGFKVLGDVKVYDVVLMYNPNLKDRQEEIEEMMKDLLDKEARYLTSHKTMYATGGHGNARILTFGDVCSEVEQHGFLPSTKEAKKQVVKDTLAFIAGQFERDMNSSLLELSEQPEKQHKPPRSARGVGRVILRIKEIA